MKKRSLMVLIVGAVAAVLGYRHLQANTTKDPNAVRVSGNVEAVDSEVSFRVPGRVLQRLVDEGRLVKAGQIVAVLDSTELAQEVALHKAEVSAAQADLAELEAGSRPEEIAQGRAMLALAKAELERSSADANRAAELYAQGIVSNRDYEIAQTSAAVSQAKVRDANERLVLLEKGPRVERIAQARARLEQARQALAASETRFGYTVVSSPITGVVLSKNVEPGEYVSPGTPVVTIGDLHNVWLRAYIDETDLGRVKVGQPVCVTTDTYRGKQYQGRVSFISSEAEFTPKSVQTEKERVKLVYRIKIDIPNPEMELKPGMPADADIRINGGGSCTSSAQSN